MSDNFNITNVYCAYIENQPYLYPSDDISIIWTKSGAGREVATGWQIIPNFFGVMYAHQNNGQNSLSIMKHIMSKELKQPYLIQYQSQQILLYKEQIYLQRSTIVHTAGVTQMIYMKHHGMIGKVLKQNND